MHVHALLMAASARLDANMLHLESEVCRSGLTMGPFHKQFNHHDGLVLTFGMALRED